MMMSIFSVYDSKTAAYLPLFFNPTKPSALRVLSDAVNDTDHQFHKHAEDYALFYLGQWNDSNAEFIIEKAPIHLCSLHELLDNN